MHTRRKQGSTRLLSGTTLVTLSCALALSSAHAQAPLILSQWSAPSGFNPLVAADQYAYQDIALMFSSLVRLNDKLQVIPELAKSWTVSKDGLQYTFYLNKNARWQDGKPVTAADVAFTYTLVANKNIPATYYSRLNSIKGFDAYHAGKAKTVEGIKVIDPTTIQFVLEKPDAVFLSNLAKSTLGSNEILPEHLLGNLQPAEVLKSSFWSKPIGSGPYKFVSYNQNQSLELEAFDDYVLGAPKIKKVFVRIGSQDVLLAQLERGEVDFASVPAPEFARTKALPTVNVTEVKTNIFQGMYPNHTRKYLQDVRVRRAIVEAIDRKALVSALLQGHGQVVKTPIAAPAWAVDNNVTVYPYDPKEAQTLLKAAGWDPGQKLVIRLGTGNKIREQSAPIIQQYLKAVGIDADIQVSDFPTLVKDMQSGNFDLALIGHGSGTDPDYTAIWAASESVPPAGNNFMRYSNPEIDRLLNQGRTTIDRAQRKVIYDKYQQILVNDVAMIWLYRPNDIYALNKRVIGAKFGPGADPFWNVSTWSLKP